MDLDAALVERLYREARADRWRLPRKAFTHALETSCARPFAGREPRRRDVARYLSSLHLEDVALACACAEGHAAAWDHFVLVQRPGLYRAADALDPGGGAREMADSLYADLYGVDSRGEARQSLLRYYHGRSSLATWLRAVLSQRFIDGHRAGRRIDPLPADLPAPESPGEADPECARLRALLHVVFAGALARLQARDRLRLGCYYAEELTLAQTGRVLGEHEATVSRQLARVRKALRVEVERRLREDHGLAPAQIERCFECLMADVGAIDLAEMLSRST